MGCHPSHWLVLFFTMGTLHHQPVIITTDRRAGINSAVRTLFWTSLDRWEIVPIPSCSQLTAPAFLARPAPVRFFFNTEIHVVHWVHHQDCRIKLPFFFHKWSRKNAESARLGPSKSSKSREKPSRSAKSETPWLKCSLAFLTFGVWAGLFFKELQDRRSGRDSAHEMLRICRNIMAYPKFGPLKTTAVDTLWTWSLLLRPILISCHSTKMALRITQGWIIYCKRSVWSACGWLKPPTGWGPQLWVGL